MNADDPTHFNFLILGTGLVESILAAALSKAGYSLLQLDQSTSYGDAWASLFLDELISLRPDTTKLLDDTVLARAGRFSLSLKPVLLPSRGPAIDVMIRSKVAAYLQFGLLAGVGLWQGAGDVKRVPASKADVFNDASMSLVEKRRLTKLLLYVASNDTLAEHALLREDPALTFQAFLEKAFSISNSTSQPLSYALALCTSSDDLALPALQRIRTLVQSTGLYGPSPYLVGHYGGAGDLVGGFSRLCAVWGGGQILGRKLHPLVTVASADVGPTTTNNPLLASSSSLPTIPPRQSTPSQPGGPDADIPKLGVPVSIEEGKDPVLFTADWVVTAPTHLDVLYPCPQPVSERRLATKPAAVSGIIVLSSPVPFPPPISSSSLSAPVGGGSAPLEDDTEDYSRANLDSNLFVFPPAALSPHLGTVTALQVGSGTNNCPDGYAVLYLNAPLLEAPASTGTAESLLEPYLVALLANSTLSTPVLTSYSYTYREAAYLPPTLPSPLPSNLLVTSALASDDAGATYGLVTSLDEATREAERMFWLVVGEQGKRDGVEFFAQDTRLDGGDDE